MWTCPECNRTFRNQSQNHFCSDKSISDFLSGKSTTSIELFYSLVSKLEEIGPVKLHATKAMIGISADRSFTHVIKLGKDFIDVGLPFNEPFAENFCFRKIALVPGSNQYNHHLRIMLPEDFNLEVIEYFRKAYANGKNI